MCSGQGLVLVRRPGRHAGAAEEAHLRVPRHIRQVSQQAQEENPPESQRGELPTVLRIRIQIARLDPDPYSESGSWK